MATTNDRERRRNEATRAHIQQHRYKSLVWFSNASQTLNDLSYVGLFNTIASSKGGKSLEFMLFSFMMHVHGEGGTLIIPS